LKIIVGISGASGTIYGYRLTEVLYQSGHEVHAVVSDHGWEVLKYECGIFAEHLKASTSYLYNINNIAASIASGSFKTDAMVIVPCSMKTLGSIACGIADNLLCRAADVTLKEGRKLILVPRETPLNALHLANMLKLAQLGVRILPASPGFYHKPQSINALVDMMVGKICDSIGVEHDLFPRWQGETAPE
jgi:4-hydroxy-3-polyprenylbenzoate decarboxylase